MNLKNLKETIIGTGFNKIETIVAHGSGSAFSDIEAFRDVFWLMSGGGKDRISRKEIINMFADWKALEQLPEKYQFWDIDLTTNQFRAPLFQSRARRIQSKLQARAISLVLGGLTDGHKEALYKLYDSVYKRKNNSDTSKEN